MFRPKILVFQPGELQNLLDDACARYQSLREQFHKSKYRYYGTDMDEKAEATGNPWCGTMVDRIRTWLDMAESELRATKAGRGFVGRHKMQLSIESATKAIAKCEEAMQILGSQMEYMNKRDKPVVILTKGQPAKPKKLTKRSPQDQG